ncbi:hypothetical protein [Desulfovibrio sp. JC010]|uniref:hypothetical protein n=1 Tax=Desulfovibrio sp. JC010 TaxID=2593641 RepID=UPI0013D83F0B|nr:hypothetical protein [Desulfovibrio sp. JC010]NDV28515.1 hypothetical protein [Desulfovibrio sp. JC010]
MNIYSKIIEIFKDNSLPCKDFDFRRKLRPYNAQMITANDVLVFVALTTFTYLIVDKLVLRAVIDGLGYKGFFSVYDRDAADYSLLPAKSILTVFTFVMSSLFVVFDDFFNLFGRMLLTIKKIVVFRLKTKIFVICVLVFLLIYFLSFVFNLLSFIIGFIFIAFVCGYFYYLSPRFLIRLAVAFCFLYLFFNLLCLPLLRDSGDKSSKVVWVRGKVPPKKTKSTVVVHLTNNKVLCGDLLFESKHGILLNVKGREINIPTSSILYKDYGPLDNIVYRLSH